MTFKDLSSFVLHFNVFSLQEIDIVENKQNLHKQISNKYNYETRKRKIRKLFIFL